MPVKRPKTQSVGLCLGLFALAPAIAQAGDPAPCASEAPSVLGNAGKAVSQLTAAVRPPAYDDLYPDYAEMCGASQRIQKNVAGDVEPAGTGGPFGHGFFYLKGACRDENAPYPQIHLCTANDPGEHGVGISLDSDFQNTDWIAVPSKQLFLHGTANPGQPLTVGAYETTKSLAKSLQILKGVKFTDAFYSHLKPGADRLEAEYESTYGTDYAVENGRNLFCVKVPLRSEELGKMVAFLNSRNAYYQANDNFVWSATNNCVTTTDNALAAAGFWNPEPISAPLYAFGHVSVPLDSFANWAVRTHDLPIENPIALFNDPDARKMLMTTGALPLRPGVVTEYLGMNTPNAVFSNSVTEEYISIPPIFGVSQGKFKKLLEDPNYLELKPSLLSLEQRLVKVKAERVPLSSLIQAMGREQRESGSSPQLSAFYDAYYKWVDQTLTQVQDQLAQLN